jgi:hypothetical protein
MSNWCFLGRGASLRGNAGAPIAVAPTSPTPTPTPAASRTYPAWFTLFSVMSRPTLPPARTVNTATITPATWANFQTNILPGINTPTTHYLSAGDYGELFLVKRQSFGLGDAARG